MIVDFKVESAQYSATATAVRETIFQNEILQDGEKVELLVVANLRCTSFSASSLADARGKLVKAGGAAQKALSEAFEKDADAKNMMLTDVDAQNIEDWKIILADPEDVQQTTAVEVMTIVYCSR